MVNTRPSLPARIFIWVGCVIIYVVLYRFLDRHTDIVKLKAELKKKDELRDAVLLVFCNKQV